MVFSRYNFTFTYYNKQNKMMKIGQSKHTLTNIRIGECECTNLIQNFQSNVTSRKKEGIISICFGIVN